MVLFEVVLTSLRSVLVISLVEVRLPIIVTIVKVVAVVSIVAVVVSVVTVTISLASNNKKKNGKYLQ